MWYLSTGTSCTDPRELIPSNSTCPHGGWATCTASPHPNHSLWFHRGFGRGASGEAHAEATWQLQRSSVRQQPSRVVWRRMAAPKHELRAPTSVLRSGNTMLMRQLRPCVELGGAHFLQFALAASDAPHAADSLSQHTSQLLAFTCVTEQAMRC